jgi:hypothetical protein
MIITDSAHSHYLQVRFILAIVEGKLEIRNKPKAVIIETLKTDGYKAFPKKSNDADDVGRPSSTHSFN